MLLLGRTYVIIGKGPSATLGISAAFIKLLPSFDNEKNTYKLLIPIFVDQPMIVIKKFLGIVIIA